MKKDEKGTTLKVSVNFAPGLSREEIRKSAYGDDPKTDWIKFLSGDKALLIALIEKRIDINCSKMQICMEMENDDCFNRAGARVSLLNEILGSLSGYT